MLRVLISYECYQATIGAGLSLFSSSRAKNSLNDIHLQCMNAFHAMTPLRQHPYTGTLNDLFAPIIKISDRFARLIRQSNTNYKIVLK